MNVTSPTKDKEMEINQPSVIFIQLQNLLKALNVVYVKWGWLSCRLKCFNWEVRILQCLIALVHLGFNRVLLFFVSKLSVNSSEIALHSLPLCNVQYYLRFYLMIYSSTACILNYVLFNLIYFIVLCIIGPFYVLNC